MAFASNRVHRAAFVRRMNENGSRKRPKSRRTASRGTAGRKTAKRRASRKIRPNRPQTGAERRAYSAGYSRIYGKKRKKKATHRARSKSGKFVAKKRRRTPAQVAAAKARKASAAAKRKASAAKKRERAAARRAKARTPEARARRARKRAKARWPKQTVTSRRRGKRKSTRVAYGPYKRARKGRKRLSYMTRGRGRRLRKIPAWAVAGAISAKEYKTSAAYDAAKARIARRRKAAAARAEAGRDPFTPNSGAKKMKSKKRRGKKGSRKAGRRKSSHRKTKRKTARRGRRKSTKARRSGSHKKKRKSARRGRRTRRVRRLKRGLYAVPNRRRKSRRKNRSRSHKLSPNRKRRSRRKLRANRKHRRSHRRLHANRKRSRKALPRRVGRRKVHRLKRGMYLVKNRRYMRNGFAGDMVHLAKTGTLIVVGFFAHKALTKVAVDLLTDTTKGTFAGMALVDSAGAPSFIATWQKPVTGLVVAGVGIAGLSMVKVGKPEARMAVGAGLMVSFLESLVKAALTAANQPKALSYLEGYSNSTAYALRGARTRRHRRHGVRGLGMARNANSIMPQYAPIGQFRQAAAGMGEYFAYPNGQSGLGEYFASSGVQGVGHYEKAGPLALQPSQSRMGQLPVDDGIRPDSNLDHVMDLAESAAGLGAGFRQAAAGVGGPQFRQAAAGMGEFFTASPSDGSFKEATVPTQSQWIPQGPLWAGTMSADGAFTESELPAGILQGPGGNGVLSG